MSTVARSSRPAPKLFAEFVGVFTFVFIAAGAAAVVRDDVALAGIAAVSLAHGLVIMAFAFAFAFGSVSGGHMNPAVNVLAAGAVRIWNPPKRIDTIAGRRPRVVPLDLLGQPAELAPRSTCF
jgi:predicted anti-sigma-YlaC factor YlaD